MRHYKILTAGFTNDPWIRAVFRHVLANGIPHGIEDTGGSRKVNTCKIAVCETDFPKCWSVHINEIDYTVGQTRFAEHPHEHLRTVHLRIGWFPYHHIATKGGTGREVATNG